MQRTYSPSSVLIVTSVWAIFVAACMDIAWAEALLFVTAATICTLRGNTVLKSIALTTSVGAALGLIYWLKLGSPYPLPILALFVGGSAGNAVVYSAMAIAITRVYRWRKCKGEGEDECKGDGSIFRALIRQGWANAPLAVR